jgi:hypothetical protein
MLLTHATLLRTKLGVDVGPRPVMAYIVHRNEPTVEWTIEIISMKEKQNSPSS